MTDKTTNKLYEHVCQTLKLWQQPNILFVALCFAMPCHALPYHALPCFATFSAIVPALTANFYMLLL